MKKTIQELAQQSGAVVIEHSSGKDYAYVEYITSEFDVEIFAGLIIAECVKQCEKRNPHPDQWSSDREYTQQRIVLECIKDIKQQFEV